MAKRRRRSFEKFLHKAVKDVVVPTSMGLGLALGGCGSSSDQPDAIMYDVMPSVKDAAVEGRDGYAIMPPVKDAAVEGRDGYAIMPPKNDAAPDTRDAPSEFTIYPIMPLKNDAAPDGTRDASSSEVIYAIMDAGRRVEPDAEPDKQDSKPDAVKPLRKDGSLIYPIMPLPVLPPRA